jgi:hypothetical protein
MIVPLWQTVLLPVPIDAGSGSPASASCQPEKAHCGSHRTDEIWIERPGGKALMCTGIFPRLCEQRREFPAQARNDRRANAQFAARCLPANGESFGEESQPGGSWPSLLSGPYSGGSPGRVLWRDLSQIACTRRKQQAQTPGSQASSPRLFAAPIVLLRRAPPGETPFCVPGQACIATMGKKPAQTCPHRVGKRQAGSPGFDCQLSSRTRRRVPRQPRAVT